LAFENGGAAFLIPYFLALLLLGLPLFILELGLGQIYRQGALGVWKKMGVPKLQGIGVISTVCTWLVSLYYNVIMAWVFYYIFCTIWAIPSGVLPWTDQATKDFTCPTSQVYVKTEAADQTDLFINATGLYMIMFKFVIPILLLGICLRAFMSFDIMKARSSEPYPKGSGYLPEWSIYIGWKLGLISVLAGILAMIFIPGEDDARSHMLMNGDE